jgi:hypothetical protein
MPVPVTRAEIWWKRLDLEPAKSRRTCALQARAIAAMRHFHFGGEYRARTCLSRRYSGLANQRATSRSHSPNFGRGLENRTLILSERRFSGPEADLPPEPSA